MIFDWIANRLWRARRLPPKAADAGVTKEAAYIGGELRSSPFKENEEYRQEIASSARKTLETGRCGGDVMEGLVQPVVLRQRAVWAPQSRAFEIRDMPIVDESGQLFSARRYGLRLIQRQRPGALFETFLSCGYDGIAIFEIDYGTTMDVIGCRVLEAAAEPIITTCALTDIETDEFDLFDVFPMRKRMQEINAIDYDRQTRAFVSLCRDIGFDPEASGSRFLCEYEEIAWSLILWLEINCRDRRTVGARCGPPTERFVLDFLDLLKPGVRDRPQKMATMHNRIHGIEIHRLPDADRMLTIIDAECGAGG